MLESLHQWLQSFDWGHFITIAVLAAFYAVVRALEHHGPSKAPEGVVARSTRRSVPGKGNRYKALFPARKFVPILRVPLLFIAGVIAVIGLQEMYISLNPHGRLAQPEVSWLGAFYFVTGALILWSCRSWVPSVEGGGNGAELKDSAPSRSTRLDIGE